MAVKFYMWHNALNALKKKKKNYVKFNLLSLSCK